MTAQQLIEILLALPPDTEVLMETENGDLFSPCFEDSGVDELTLENGETELIYVIAPCFCNFGDEEVFADGVNVDILENVN